MQLKVAYGRLKAECKKNKKYSLECVKVIEELKRELDNVKRSGVAGGGGGGPQNARSIQREAELNDKVKEERERRRALEEEVELLKDRADKEARALRDSEVRSPGATSKRQRGDGSDRVTSISFPSIQAEIERLQKSNTELEQENEAVHDHAEAAKDELRQVRDELDRKEDEEHSRSGGGGRVFDAEFDELRRRAEDLEDVRLLSPLHQPEICEADALLRSVLPIQELEAAHTQLEAQKTSIETFKDEREELLDEREELHKQLDRVEGGQSNRSMSRAGNEDFDRVRPPLPLTFTLLSSTYAAPVLGNFSFCRSAMNSAIDSPQPVSNSKRRSPSSRRRRGPSKRPTLSLTEWTSSGPTKSKLRRLRTRSSRT